MCPYSILSIKVIKFNTSLFNYNTAKVVKISFPTSLAVQTTPTPFMRKSYRSEKNVTHILPFARETKAYQKIPDIAEFLIGFNFSANFTIMSLSFLLCHITKTYILLLNYQMYKQHIISDLIYSYC